MEKYIEEARKLGIVLYVPNFTNDAMLANWYKYLIDNNEFETLFTENHKPLSKFYKIFEPPTVLAYAADESGEIWATMWFTPFDGYGGKSASVSAWTRKDYRGGAEARKAGGLCYSLAFEVWDVLTSITRHEGLLRNLRQVGYNILGSIPNLVEGSEGWILYLTKENFKNSIRYGEK